MKIGLLLLTFSFACAAHAASGGRSGQAARAATAAAVAIPSNGFTRGGSGRTPDPRHAGPLDEKRKINEQDCSKPIDLTAGNLKCK